MLRQLKFDANGEVQDKVETAIARLQTYQDPDGDDYYHLAFSGGKDSQAVYHLCEMAGVRFKAVYRVTSVDPPELVRFIMDRYPDPERDHPENWSEEKRAKILGYCSREYPVDKDGKRITMWNLVPRKKMPPTRVVRYCCEYFKETAGNGEKTVTGVRHAESPNRKKNQGNVTFPGKTKHVQTVAQAYGAEGRETDRGGTSSIWTTTKRGGPWRFATGHTKL